MRDLNPKAATDGQGTFHFKCLFLDLLLLSAIFHTFLKIKILNKMYSFKNESNYLLRQFEENPPIFTHLSWSYFIFIYFSV